MKKLLMLLFVFVVLSQTNCMAQNWGNNNQQYNDYTVRPYSQKPKHFFVLPIYRMNLSVIAQVLQADDIIWDDNYSSSNSSSGNSNSRNSSSGNSSRENSSRENSNSDNNSRGGRNSRN